jgi:hypothetical protein
MGSILSTNGPSDNPGTLHWFTADFVLYGISNVGNLTTTIVDPLLELVPGAIAGGVIAGVLRRMASPIRESPDVSTRRAA